MLKPIPVEITTAISEAKDRMPGSVLVVNHLKKQNGEDCSINKGAAMKVYRKDDGWYFHCFRCGYQGFISDASQTPEELKARWEALKAQKSTEGLQQITMPHDFVPMEDPLTQQEIPDEAWHWFWGYHIRTQTITKYGIGWSDSYQRVLVPCKRTAVVQPSGDYAYELLGWIGREVYCKTKEERKEKGVIKYLTKKSNHVKHLYFHAPTNSQRIVLVEDCISAMKVSESAGISALALLTTYIPDTLMMKLKDRKIKIWLDGDMLAKSVGYVQKFSQRGFNVGYIHSEHDPKQYDYRDLMDILNPIKEE